MNPLQKLGRPNTGSTLEWLLGTPGHITVQRAKCIAGVGDYVDRPGTPSKGGPC